MNAKYKYKNDQSTQQNYWKCRNTNSYIHHKSRSQLVQDMDIISDNLRSCTIYLLIIICI